MAGGGVCEAVVTSRRVTAGTLDPLRCISGVNFYLACHVVNVCGSRRGGAQREKREMGGSSRICLRVGQSCTRFATVVQLLM